MAILLAVAIGAGAACSTAITRESFIPIPEHPPAPSAREDVRGTQRQVDRLPLTDQVEIAAEVIQRFYRPMMQQARWVDPRPLSHERTQLADSAMAPDHNRAILIVDAARVDRVCLLSVGNERCRGLAGGVLRFSPAYAVGSPNAARADSALIYVRYAPRSYGVETEIEFFLTRSADGWFLVSRRSMPALSRGEPASLAADPQRALDSLLATDRAFAVRARDTTVVAALSAMFVDNVYLQAPGGFAHGLDSAIAALATDSANAGSRMTWTPIRAGVSSDGTQGFTLGYVTVTRADGSTRPAKYVAYWVLAESGWRVAAYKRVPRPVGDVSMEMLPPSLPVRALAVGDERTVQRYADELSRAEHAFSRDAGEIGLGPAFAKWGAPDAVNAGGPTDAEFVRGPRAISESVSAGIPPDLQISWGPETVIVARTGDLGVSIGTIRVSSPATPTRAAGTREVPFFTIWKRAYPADPWRYVAE